MNLGHSAWLQNPACTLPQMTDFSVATFSRNKHPSLKKLDEAKPWHRYSYHLGAWVEVKRGLRQDLGTGGGEARRGNVYSKSHLVPIYYWQK